MRKWSTGGQEGFRRRRTKKGTTRKFGGDGSRDVQSMPLDQLKQFTAKGRNVQGRGLPERKRKCITGAERV